MIPQTLETTPEYPEVDSTLPPTEKPAPKADDTFQRKYDTSELLHRYTEAVAAELFAKTEFERARHALTEASQYLAQRRTQLENLLDVANELIRTPAPNTRRAPPLKAKESVAAVEPEVIRRRPRKDLLDVDTVLEGLAPSSKKAMSDMVEAFRYYKGEPISQEQAFDRMNVAKNTVWHRFQAGIRLGIVVRKSRGLYALR